MSSNPVRIFSVLLAASAAALAQQPADDTDIRVDVEAVNLLVAVTDRVGRSVTTLTKDNFGSLRTAANKPSPTSKSNQTCR